jgi:hypothetical protein
MKYLIACVLFAVGQAVAQQATSTCRRVDFQTVNCESSLTDTTYVPPDLGAASAQGIANAQATTNGLPQAQLLQQQIGQQRLQNELRNQQLEVQRRTLVAQDEHEDHQMRLERLQRSIVSSSTCLKDHTPQECSSNPDAQAVREDIARGRISQNEFLQAIKRADQFLKASY